MLVDLNDTFQRFIHRVHHIGWHATKSETKAVPMVPFDQVSVVVVLGSRQLSSWDMFAGNCILIKSIYPCLDPHTPPGSWGSKHSQGIWITRDIQKHSKKLQGRNPI